MNTSRKEFIRTSLLGAAGLSGLPGLLNNNPLHNAKKTSPRSSDNTGFKISIFSKHLQWLGYDEMAEVAAELGFEGVDLTVRPRGHVLPERVAEDLPKAVEAVRNNGMEVYMITTSITDSDEEHTESILKTAGSLGVRNYRTGWFPYDKKLSLPDNLEIFKAKLKRLADLNKEYRIQGDYQNHAGTSFGSSIWDLWMVLQEINTPWIGSQYDIRHATVEGTNTWPLGLELIGPHIGTLDIKDFHWTKNEGSWQIENVPLGEGMVDFERFFKLLKQHDIAAPISVHYEYPLGGANHGATSLTIEREVLLAKMKKDLEILKGWL